MKYISNNKIFFLFAILFISCVTEPTGCGKGFTEIDNICYNDIDLNVLKSIIDNNFKNNSKLKPLDLTIQKWNENGRLTLLSLYDDSLIGSIPNNIGDLIYLDTLNLSYNKITGEIPESIGKLENLNYLYLYSNEISGIIPDTICNIFPNLSNFWIQYNNLCPPYPKCIPDKKIFPQNTVNCNANNF